MKIKNQKYIILSLYIFINILLAGTFIIYQNRWYCYLFILALASTINSTSCILNIGYKMLYTESIENRIDPSNYIYILPCYNETKEELTKTLNSLVLQREVKRDKRLIIIICDGINKNNCDTNLKSILKINNNNSQYFSYTTWDKTDNIIQIYKSAYTYLCESLPVILLIKNTNYGKRDSLVLVRNLCYKYNQSLLLSAESVVDNHLNLEMINNLNTIFLGEEINYIIGIDADTEFDYNCSYELIEGIRKDKDIHGCVGYVSIISDNYYSPFILYQYAEYMFAQCLRRYTQSHITQKVNCLSGCVQILRISEETCGDKILAAFNYLPEKEESIFKHIRSYASEDRNHVCNMLSLYPYVKTTQNVKAIAYTKVPMSISVFLSQRRRWSLGANCNDMLLVYLPGIVFVERISALVNVMTYSFTPFIFIATILFIKSIIENPTMLMLYLSIIIFIPMGYAFIMVPVFIFPTSFRNTMYYYLSYIFFLTFGSIVGLIINIYSISCMDVIKWGKTRKIVEADAINAIIDKNALVITIDDDDEEHYEEYYYDDENYINIDAQ